MAAEPAPPGPPGDDDFAAALADLDGRVAELEHYRRHEAPYSAQAFGLGLEVLRQEARDLAVMLTRVIGRQDQDGSALRDVAAVQREQGAILERIGRVLERHGRTLEAHGDQLAAVGARLDGHGQRLDGIDGKLAAHGEMLAEILRRLPRPAE